MAVNSQISELLAQALRAEIEESSWSFVVDKTCHKECRIFLDRCSISRGAMLLDFGRFCVSTNETGERSLGMLEPTNFSEELRRVIGKVRR